MHGLVGLIGIIPLRHYSMYTALYQIYVTVTLILLLRPIIIAVFKNKKGLKMCRFQ